MLNRASTSLKHSASLTPVVLDRFNFIGKKKLPLVLFGNSRQREIRVEEWAGEKCLRTTYTNPSPKSFRYTETHNPPFQNTFFT